jgi:hypothetical protein
MEKAVGYWLLAFSLAGDVAIDIGQPDLNTSRPAPILY